MNVLTSAAYLQTTWRHKSNAPGVSNLSLGARSWASKNHISSVNLNGQGKFTPANSLTSESHNGSWHLTCFIWKDG